MNSHRKARLIGHVGAAIMRLWLSTLRWSFTDHARVMADPPEKPLLWVFWHNRLFALSYMFEKFFPGRPGAALVSASKDGEIIATIMERFGIRPIRGSSSRRGAAALVEMKRSIEAGYITAVTPDGPRGPKYSVGPGLVKLAQVTQGTVLPMEVRYSSFWALKSWDRFRLPKPFSKVHVTFHPVVAVAKTNSDSEFEAERLRLEKLLFPAAGDE